jgi:hypothetical protein
MPHTHAPINPDFLFRAAIELEIPGFELQVRRFGLRGQLTRYEPGMLRGIARTVAAEGKPRGARALNRHAPEDDFTSLFDSGTEFLLLAR